MKNKIISETRNFFEQEEEEKIIKNQKNYMNVIGTILLYMKVKQKIKQHQLKNILTKLDNI